MESRIIDLEIRITHLEAALQDLNDVLVDQQRQINRLSAEGDALKQRLRSLSQSPTASPMEETPPPHY